MNNNKIERNEEYSIIRELGSGNFGTTYLVEKKGVQYALKEFTYAGDNIDKAWSLFEREARTLQKLQHEQIPKFNDYFEISDKFYIVQQCIQGSDLSNSIKENITMPQDWVEYLFKGILPVLDYIHERKVIHRDIKPSNIIEGIDRKFYLIDFGAVKIKEVEAKSGHKKTKIYTPGYSPEEQIYGEGVYPSSDLYALGRTAIFALTGIPPEKYEWDPEAGLLTIDDEHWRRKANVNEHLANILDKMVHLDHKQRYQSALEVLNSLETTLDQDLQTEIQKISGDMSRTRPSSGNTSRTKQPSAKELQFLTPQQRSNNSPRSRQKPTKKLRYLIPVLIALPVALLALIFLRSNQGNFSGNEPFNKEFRGTISCNKLHPQKQKINIEIDRSDSLSINEVREDVYILAEKYAYAMGRCILNVSRDKDEVIETYEFILLDLVTYESVEMDIVLDGGKPRINEFEREISMEKIDNYEDLNFVHKIISNQCDGNSIKVEISHRDEQIYPGLSLKGKNIYYEFECKSIQDNKLREFEIDTESPAEAKAEPLAN